jgi:hypothetical protein
MALLLTSSPLQRSNLLVSCEVHPDVHTSALSFSRRSASGATSSFHVPAAVGGAGCDQCGIRPRFPISVGARKFAPPPAFSVAHYRVAQHSPSRCQLCQLAVVRLSRSDVR